MQNSAEEEEDSLLPLLSVDEKLLSVDEKEDDPITESKSSSLQTLTWWERNRAFLQSILNFIDRLVKLYQAEISVTTLQWDTMNEIGKSAFSLFLFVLSAFLFLFSLQTMYTTYRVRPESVKFIEDETEIGLTGILPADSPIRSSVNRRALYDYYIMQLDRLVQQEFFSTSTQKEWQDLLYYLRLLRELGNARLPVALAERLEERIKELEFEDEYEDLYLQLITLLGLLSIEDRQERPSSAPPILVRHSSPTSRSSPLSPPNTL